MTPTAHTDTVPTLVETLASQLERPRNVTAQVADYLSGNYEVDEDGIGVFLVERLPALEDYEHDLILSPLFTPKLADQAIFADLLGRQVVAREQWPDVIQQLVSRPTRAHLVTVDRRVHEIVLREVTLERYVHRLRLDGRVPEAVFELVEQVSPETDRPLIKAIARRAVWETTSRQSILSRYLASTATRGGYQQDDAIYLLELVESYRPADVGGLLAMIPPWLKRLQHEIDTGANSKPFFTAQTQGEHGGDRDQRRPDERRLDMKRKELESLRRLEQILKE
ncbi:MAG TPA: hypothetical protein VFR18_10165 [Terriglobia bacterium]|nr:hypothetical protein [Terriglobia bacterium]